MGDRTYSFDANLQLSDGSAANTASGFAQVGGVDAILDLGGNQGVTPTQQARMDGVVVIDVNALDIASGDERYTFKLLGSNDSNFGVGNVAELAGLSIGKGTSGTPATLTDGVVGRYELLFCSEQASVKYQYVKLYVSIAGTTPTITFIAFIAVLPEP